ncbi:MAG: GntR family transcriptional regulator [Peptoniphilus sp.]|uniref:GntR family transcriptional regulator n=1 Tax=Peptoniphilus sp. TaxID=1971214 RepID=UPI0025F4E01A|nr:GntR family transcriptional regulator [Peptoniphilus sp.]MCI5642798.1 GntR family transcriptional regulator [Peptoniphilus sp.]MDD7352287.1 GntR family transcriptional regulator [Peptoniphilaceae bacterium]MDY3903040.1 GntR family transcriptional regulator [Peptoniphilus sp.]
MLNMLLENSRSEKINRTFIKDEVYDTLSNWIITGYLEPETKININSLSEQLGISRTPVREAILKLENEGLILSKANRWTIVAPIDLDASFYTYSVVASLEMLALEQAFDKIDDEFINNLQKINAKLDLAFKNLDTMELLNYDNEFHDSFIYLSKNPELPSIIHPLKKKIQRVELSFFKDNDGKSNTFGEHKALIDALKKRDLELAKLCLKANWYNSINLVKEKSKRK